MDSLQHSFVLLPASAAVVSMFDPELSSVWTNKETLPAVYKAIDSLESMCVRLRNNTTLEQPNVTGTLSPINILFLLLQTYVI